MILKTRTNASKKQKKNCSRNLRTKCRSHLNHNLFSENFIYDPSDVYFKPIGTANMKIKRQDFKRKQNYKKKIFLKLRKLVLSKS